MLCLCSVEKLKRDHPIFNQMSWKVLDVGKFGQFGYRMFMKEIEEYDPDILVIGR